MLLGAVLFVSLGLVFAVIRAPEQIGEIEADFDPSSIRDLVEATPCAPLAARRGSFSSPPLSKSGRRHRRMGGVVSGGTLVAIVGVAMFLFFVVLGMITVPPHLQATWIGQPPNVLFT